MKKLSLFKLSFVSIFTLAFMLNIFSANELLAAAPDYWGNQQSKIGETIGATEKDPRLIAAGIINIVLSFLGILALALILFAGFKWMTAAGSDEKVGEAKKLLIAAIIGLIIILSAFALSTFLLDAVYKATGGR